MLRENFIRVFRFVIQTYQNYEVCIVDDCSTNLETINTLKEYENKDTR
ncbi:MAG: glycosyltransferase [Thomasclavelia ramosa]